MQITEAFITTVAMIRKLFKKQVAGWISLSTTQVKLLSEVAGGQVDTEHGKERIGLMTLTWRKQPGNLHNVSKKFNPEYSLEDWCWSWSSDTLATWCDEPVIAKDSNTRKDWGQQEEKGAIEDEMIGWHHQVNGHEFKQPPGDTEGQGSLACCSPWGHKQSDTT